MSRTATRQRRPPRTRRKRAAEARVLAESIVTAQAEARKAAKRGAGTPEDPIRFGGGSTLYRLRWHTLPWAVATGLLGVAEVTHLAAGYAHQLGGATAVGAAVAVGVGLLVYTILARGTGHPQWRSALYCLTAAVWLPVGIWHGATWNTMAALAVATVVLGAKHWHTHHIPAPSGPRITDGTPRTIPELWRANIACPNGPLTNAHLLDHKPVKYGDAFTVQLDPGKQHLRQVMGKLPEIASGLRTRLQYLLLEDLPDNDDSSLVRLQVITASPIKQTVWFTQPAWEDGHCLLGPYADGVGHARLRLYTDDSMWSGYLGGGTGSGKSRLLEEIAVSTVARGDTVVLYIDGQNGASSSSLWRGLRSFTAADAPTVAAALKRIAARRQVENRDQGIDGFTPSAARPGILVIIDECQVIWATKTAAKVWEEIVRECRKLGVSVFAASQHPGIETFGGREGLRAALWDGNCIVLRTTSAVGKGILPNMDLEPAEFPKDLPGYGYVIAAPGSAERTAPFRGWRVATRNDHPDAPVTTTAGWLADLPRVELDAVASDAAGPDMTDSDERQLQPVVPEPVAADDDPELGSMQVIAFPQPQRVAPPTSTDAVYAAVRGDAGTPMVIAARTGLSDRRVRQLLRALVDEGRVERVGHGRYEVSQP